MIRAGNLKKKADEWAALELKATKTKMTKRNAKALKKNKIIHNWNYLDGVSTCRTLQFYPSQDFIFLNSLKFYIFLNSSDRVLIIGICSYSWYIYNIEYLIL